MDRAFRYVKARGITLEENYPYTSGTGTTGLCHSAKIVNPIKIAGFKDISAGDCDDLATAL